jgi:hypothetical protein
MARRSGGNASKEADRAANSKRQRRYRKRLKAECHPESDDVRRAVFRAISRERRSHGSGDEPYNEFVETVLRNSAVGAINGLERQEFNRPRAKRRLLLALIPPIPGLDEPNPL